MISENQADATELPTAQWRQIAVCFTDIGKISRFASREDALAGKWAHELLNCFSRALSIALEHAANDSRPAIKAMGGRLMVVWEYPTHGHNSTLPLQIFDFIGSLQRSFVGPFPHRDAQPAFSVGLSCGYALKVVGFGGDVADYVGAPVMEASSLQKRARPQSIVAKLGVAPNLFMERQCAREGRIYNMNLEFGNTIPVWQIDDHRTLRPRRARLTHTFDGAETLLNDLSSGWEPTTTRALAGPLTDSDLVSVFDVREEWEANFARDLATRVKEHQVGVEALEPIRSTITEMDILLASGIDPQHPPDQWNRLGVEFHSRIADLSHGEQGRRRGDFVRQIYELTKGVYSAAIKNPDTLQQVIADHRVVLRQIADGESENARSEMWNHLKRHFDRARNGLLGSLRPCSEES